MKIYQIIYKIQMVILQGQKSKHKSEHKSKHSLPFTFSKLLENQIFVFFLQGLIPRNSIFKNQYHYHMLQLQYHSNHMS